MSRLAEGREALHLSAMNMVYEGIRQRGTMMIVPRSAVETMGLGDLTGIAAMAKSQERADDENE